VGRYRLEVGDGDRSPRPSPTDMAGPSCARIARWAALSAVAAGVMVLGIDAPAFGVSVPVGAPPPVVVALGVAPPVPIGAHDAGAVESGMPLTLDIVLAPRDPASLGNFLQLLDDPGSPVYHQFLAKGQFGPRFGPAPSTVSKVNATLAGLGLPKGSSSSNSLELSISTTAGKAESAFGVRLRTYRLASGNLVYANTTAPEAPSAIGPYVVGILGLSNVAQMHPLLVGGASGQSVGATSPQPTQGRLATSTSGPGPCVGASNAGGYTADQIAHAYGFDTGAYDLGRFGTGKTVALYELEPFRSSDIGTYQTCYGISTGGTMTNVHQIAVDGGAGSGPGSGEAALDIENVAGLAPAASVNVYEAPNSGAGPFDEYKQIANDDSAQVVSTSWGTCEPSEGLPSAQSEELVFEQMAAQGQSLFAAAGDSGSEDCHRPGPPSDSFLAVDDPAGDPYVTGVGGTNLTSIGTPPTETVWNASASSNGAGGGGISTFWQMPSWQTALGVNSDSSGAPCSAPAATDCREVPDVSASADISHGYVIQFQGRWMTVGGTSGAAPLWAALVSLADEGCTSPAGLVNPALYAHQSDLNDITSGNNDYIPSGNTSGLYPATAGYDMASGLGSPTSALFAPGVLCTGPASKLSVTTEPPLNSGVGSTFNVRVSVEDASGNVVSADNADSVTLAITPGTGPTASTLACISNPVKVSAGVANFMCSIGEAGAGFTLTASDSPLAPAVTDPVAIAPAGGVQPQPQTISFAGPGDGTAGGSSILVATASSGLPVTFTVDPSSGAGACSASQGTVTYTATGTCVIDAAQAGDASFLAASPVSRTIVVSAPIPPAPAGYDLVGNDGGVFVFGQSGSGFYGSLPGLGVSTHDIVGIVPTADFKGYLLVGADGGVFAFGDAVFENSLPGLGISVDNIIGIVPTADFKGYLLVASDGGVFAFGDAVFENSLPGLGISVDNIVGIARSTGGAGYWLVSSNGAVYALGDANSYGAAAGSSPGRIAGITSTFDGGGYWLVGSNGSVLVYGDGAFFGSLPVIGVGVDDIVSLVPTPTSAGYWLIGSDGGVFAFGTAREIGSLPASGITVNDIVGGVLAG